MKQTVLDIAANLGRAVRENGRQLQHERSTDGFYLRLSQADERFRLIITHRDREPGIDECLEIAAAAGAPEGCNPVRTVIVLMSQDCTPRVRRPGWVVGWREIR